MNWGKPMCLVRGCDQNSVDDGLRDDDDLLCEEHQKTHEVLRTHYAVERHTPRV